MARPSPRTGTTGEGIQKFGTQQLKYLDPTQPALGVIETDYGAPFRLTTGGEATIPKTLFSQQYQEKRPATIRTYEQLATSPHAPPVGLGSFEFPDLGGLFNGKDNGEDCGWFGEKCREKDNGEDCGWFGEKCWFKLPAWDLGWIKWVLLAVGIGILLWLLRPLFYMIGAFKGGAV